MLLRQNKQRKKHSRSAGTFRRRDANRAPRLQLSFTPTNKMENVKVTIPNNLIDNKFTFEYNGNDYHVICPEGYGPGDEMIVELTHGPDSRADAISGHHDGQASEHGKAGDGGRAGIDRVASDGRTNARRALPRRQDRARGHAPQQWR